MSRMRLGGQADLFPTPGQPETGFAAELAEPPPPDFIDGIRDELKATLARVTAAGTLPWRDLTQAYLAEMRFHSMSGWLTQAEAARLRAAFDAEMERLYGASAQ